MVPKVWVDKIYEGHMIRTIFGSELIVVGLDKPQRIEGVPWDGCIIDESSDIKPGTFDLNIFPALADREGWCWRIGVPKRAGIGAIEFKASYDQGVKAGRVESNGTLLQDQDRIESFTWFSSTVLPQKIIDYARQTLAPKDYAEQFEASWETESGLLYDAFHKEFNVRPVIYDSRLPVDVSCDFNVDPMAWCFGQENEGTIGWFDELWLRNTNTRAALDETFKRFTHHKKGFRFFGDAAGHARKTSASESDYQIILNDSRFKAMGRTVHFPKSNPRCVDRYAACNGMFLNADGERRMFVDPKCEHLLQGLMSDCFKEGTREPLDGPDRLHMTDAMGYMVYYTHPVVCLDGLPEDDEDVRIGVG